MQTNVSPHEAVQVKVEDDRTGMSPATLKRAFADNLFYGLGKYETWASLSDYYMALAYTVRDRCCIALSRP